jgi:hypothetical protein
MTAPNRGTRGLSVTDKHPKRPRDLNQWAKRTVDLATGEAEEKPGEKNEGVGSRSGARNP